MGRPLQNEASLRLRVVCSLTPMERVEIEAKAREAGLPMSVFLGFRLTPPATRI